MKHFTDTVRRGGLVSAIVAALFLSTSVVAAPTTLPDVIPDDGVFVTRALLAPPVGRGGRTAVAVDPLYLALATEPTAVPEAGDPVPGARASATWTALDANEKGELVPRGRRGTIHAVVESPRDQVVLLAPRGHGTLLVNGEPRVGDPYGNGRVRIPVRLDQGSNRILLTAGGRSPVSVRVLPISDRPFMSGVDDTMPDVLRRADGSAAEPTVWAGVVVANPTGTPWTGGRMDITVGGPDGPALTESTALPPIAPYSTRKVPVRLSIPDGLDGETAAVRLVLLDDGESVHDRERTIRIADPTVIHRRTFVSDIDGSVQEYAVQPASVTDEDADPGVLLSLHGAGVGARGQANSYRPKSTMHVVAPTNRRRFGFDWEDWGRLDAFEVLRDARRHLTHDPARTWVSGHSMGGHGAWQLGALFPDRWAAVGPSGGWPSFRSYMTGNPDLPPASGEMESMFRRAGSGSQTLDVVENLDGLGVFVLHGERDDNVPVAQARIMRERLASFHPDFVYREQPGAGHWWGRQCVDWPPMIDFFAARSIAAPQPTDEVRFVTPSPGLSSSRRWVEIVQQVEPWRLSTVELRRDLAAGRIEGRTENVERLALRVDDADLPTNEDAPEQPTTLTIAIDESSLEHPWPATGVVELVRLGGAWSPAPERRSAEKHPGRSGPFKDAFRNRAVLVHGTIGSSEESDALLARARFDAETFQYRGNGGFEVIPDSAFDPERYRDRNVILYGNVDTNGAWAPLLGDSPVDVRRGEVRVGGTTVPGEDLMVFFVRPRPDSDVASVGVVAATSDRAVRASARPRLFVSGVGWPDLTVMDASVLSDGLDGVRCAGFFGNDWSVERGAWAWTLPERDGDRTAPSTGDGSS